MIELSNLPSLYEKAFMSDAFVRREQVSHMAIGAHPDDLEILGGAGLQDAQGDKNSGFFGLVLTNGLGSVRRPQDEKLSNQDYIDLRWSEQVEAAKKGRYLGVVGLELSSSAIKGQLNSTVKDLLKELLSELQPKILYTHNLFDRHLTHVWTAIHVIEALRDLPVADRPEQIYGCEVWRDLDWVNEDMRVALDISDVADQVQDMLACYRSQNYEGKNYDKATVARALSHATFYESHQRTRATHLTYAINLKPLVCGKQSYEEHIQRYLSAFSQSLMAAFENSKGLQCKS